MLFNYSAARLCQRWAINPDWATQSYTNRRACVCLSVCTCDCVKAVCSPRALLKVLCVFVWCVHMWELVLYINSRAACVCVFIAEVRRFGWESRPVEYGEEGNSRRSGSRESCVCWNIKQKKTMQREDWALCKLVLGKFLACETLLDTEARRCVVSLYSKSANKSFLERFELETTGDSFHSLKAGKSKELPVC